MKIALGLSCKTLGADYVRSQEAALLRTFFFEHDAEVRATIPIRGRVGATADITPRFSKTWHPGGAEHIFALISVPPSVGFVANLFGMFENFIEIDRTGAFASKLPGRAIPGIVWTVDPVRKVTVSEPLVDVVRRTAT